MYLTVAEEYDAGICICHYQTEKANKLQGGGNSNMYTQHGEIGLCPNVVSGDESVKMI